MLEFPERNENLEKPDGRPIEHGRRGLEELIDNTRITRLKDKKPVHKPIQLDDNASEKAKKEWEFKLKMLFAKHRSKDFKVREEDATLFLGQYQELLKQCEQLGGQESVDIELVGCVLTESENAQLIEELTLTMPWGDFEEQFQAVLHNKEWVYLGLLTQELNQDIMEVVRISKPFHDHFESKGFV